MEEKLQEWRRGSYIVQPAGGVMYPLKYKHAYFHTDDCFSASHTLLYTQEQTLSIIILCCSAILWKQLQGDTVYKSNANNATNNNNSMYNKNTFHLSPLTCTAFCSHSALSHRMKAGIWHFTRSGGYGWEWQHERESALLMRFQGMHFIILIHDCEKKAGLGHASTEEFQTSSRVRVSLG